MQKWSFVVVLRFNNPDGTVEYLTRRGEPRRTHDREKAKFFGTVTDVSRVIDEFKALDPTLDMSYEMFETFVTA